MKAMPLVLTEPETQAQAHAVPKPIPQWKVLLHNDEITTFEFVTELLIRLFHKPHQEAVKLTLEVHECEVACIAITTQERAELYLEQIHSLARPRGFPLTATIEPE